MQQEQETSGSAPVQSADNVNKALSAQICVGMLPERLLASVFGKVGRASMSEWNQYLHQHRQHRENV